MSRDSKIIEVEAGIKFLSHEQLVQILHIIRSSVELSDLIEKDGSVYIFYDKINDDLLTRMVKYIQESTRKI